MARDDFKFVLPGRIDSYLAALNRHYASSGDSLLQRIVVNATLSVEEGWHYDNWDGGTYGHAVTLTVPDDIFLEAFNTKDTIESRIESDLNKLNTARNEHVARVALEVQVADPERWRENSGVLHTPSPTSRAAPGSLQRIWGTHSVRLFLSHKATVKVETTALKLSLAEYGIGAFVAHEDIEPTREWQGEIELALFSMDALVALLSEDFHESHWTDQEVGVAIGRGVPLISVRLGRDPYGLMGKGQALGGCTLKDPSNIAIKLFALLCKRLPDKDRMFDCALGVYERSGSFEDSGWRVETFLTPFASLDDQQVSRVIGAFMKNTQNRYSFRGKKALLPLLERWTGKSWSIVDDELRRSDA